MLPIVIMEDSFSKMAQPLSKLFENCCDLIVVGKDHFSIRGRHPDLILFSAAQRSHICARAPVVILPQGIQTQPDVFLPQDSILLFDSQDRNAASFAASSGLRVLDCGLSSRATLTFSSIAPENAVICLQRPIEDRRGNIIEPFELPLGLKTESNVPYLVLCCAGALILSGKWHAMKDVIF